MSGLYSTLNASVKALNAQSEALDITGKNIANVNNSSYARQRVIFGDRGTIQTPQGAESLGLEAMSVQSLRDQLLDRQVSREAALKSGYEAEQEAYQRAQASLGQTVDSASSTASANSASTGLESDLNNFFSSFQSMAASPTDVGVRQTLLQNANILTDRLNQTDTRLAQVQSDLNSQVTTDVAGANILLQAVADINTQITRAEVGNPGSAVDLRDQRQQKIEELATKLPVDAVTSATGTLQLTMKDTSGNAVVLVDGSTVNGTVAFNGTTITAGSPATAVVPVGGSIQGALTARDGAVATLRGNLNSLAQQLVTSVNSAYAPAGGTFFSPTGTSASTIQVNSALTSTTLAAGTGAAGDNSVALAVAAVATQQFSTSSGDAINGNISQFYSSTVSGIGQALSSVNSEVDDQTKITQLITNQRQSVSGVSMDEEMSDLVRYQRAYQASSEVFQVIDQLLSTLATSLGSVSG